MKIDKGCKSDIAGNVSPPLVTTRIASPFSRRGCKKKQHVDMNHESLVWLVTASSFQGVSKKKYSIAFHHTRSSIRRFYCPRKGNGPYEIGVINQQLVPFRWWAWSIAMTFVGKASDLDHPFIHRHQDAEGHIQAPTRLMTTC